jgi:hypothetical protein
MTLNVARTLAVAIMLALTATGGSARSRVENWFDTFLRKVPSSH